MSFRGFSIDNINKSIDRLILEDYLAYKENGIGIKDDIFYRGVRLNLYHDEDISFCELREDLHRQIKDINDMYS